MRRRRWEIVVSERPVTTSRGYVFDWQAHLTRGAAGTVVSFGTAPSFSRAVRSSRKALRVLERELDRQDRVKAAARRARAGQS